MADTDAKPTVYIETTIVSLLTARPSNSVLGQAHQLTTRDWWDFERANFELYTSDFTLDEAGGGDPSAAADRLAVLGGLSLLPVTAAVTSLSEELDRAMGLPRRAATDAAHLAVTAVAGIDYLLTWNCRHLANPALARKIGATCHSAGFVAPQIVTPEQLRNKQ